MFYKESMSSKKLIPSQIRKDNSNIWRYSTELGSELRKENYSKSYPEDYLAYKDALGELAPISPFDDMDLQMDLEIFKKSLSPLDRNILSLWLLGMIMDEIAEECGLLSKASISKRLKKIFVKFQEFYQD